MICSFVLSDRCDQLIECYRMSHVPFTLTDNHGTDACYLWLKPLAPRCDQLASIITVGLTPRRL